MYLDWGKDMCPVLKQGRKEGGKGRVDEHMNEPMNEQAADLYLFRLGLPAFRCCSGHATIGKVLSFTLAALPPEGWVDCCVPRRFVFAEGRKCHAAHWLAH